MGHLVLLAAFKWFVHEFNIMLLSCLLGGLANLVHRGSMYAFTHFKFVFIYFQDEFFISPYYTPSLVFIAHVRAVSK